MKNFIIVDMPEIDDAQIILGRPLLATAGCHIDVRLWFEVQGCYAMFCQHEDKVDSPNSSLLDEFPPSSEIDTEHVLTCEDPPDFDWISIENPYQRYVKVEFTAPTPPSMPKVEAHASNDSAMSDYYKFAQAVLSLPLME